MVYIDYIWPGEEVLFSPGAFDVPFTEIYPEETSTPPVTTGTPEADEASVTPGKPSETSKPSATPKSPSATPKPGKTNEAEETPEKSATAMPTPTKGSISEPNPYPQGRGINGLARPISHGAAQSEDPYPIESPTAEPPATTPTQTPETSTATPVPTEKTKPNEQTPTAEDPKGTVTPTPTRDLSQPEPTRQYPETFLVDLIIVPGEFGSAPVPFNPLKASQAAFEDETIAKVSVVNNLNVDLPHAVVYVLVYDADGHIVGGGKTLSESIRSSSATEVQVPIAYRGEKQGLSLKAFVGLTKKALTLP